MGRVVIDHVVKSEVDVDEYHNELVARETLKAGLRHIANHFIRRESIWRAAGGDKFKYMNFGQDLDGTYGELPLHACMFHWFANTLSNYSRITGLIHCLATRVVSRADLGIKARSKTVKDAVDEYVNGVSEIAAPIKWRNKVSAHFAITDPRADNLATLDMSVVFPVRA
jgi:hypothetical protein